MKSFMINLRNVVLFLFILSCLWIVSCTSDNGEIQIDCSESDLEVSISDIDLPACGETGSFNVIATGGTGEYLYSLNNQSLGMENSFTGLGSGVYTLKVSDGNCTVETEVDLRGNGVPDLSVDYDGCEDGQGEITASAVGGVPPYTFRLNNRESQDNGVFTQLSFGKYVVTVTDSEGCETVSEDIQLGVSLQTDIMPIINTYCSVSGCHADSQSPLLENTTDVISAADRIKARTLAKTMPPDGSLPDSEIQKIADWVDCGANDN